MAPFRIWNQCTRRPHLVCALVDLIVNKHLDTARIRAQIADAERDWWQKTPLWAQKPLPRSVTAESPEDLAEKLLEHFVWMRLISIPKRGPIRNTGLQSWARGIYGSRLFGWEEAPGELLRQMLLKGAFEKAALEQEALLGAELAIEARNADQEAIEYERTLSQDALPGDSETKPVRRPRGRRPKVFESTGNLSSNDGPVGLGLRAGRRRSL